MCCSYRAIIVIVMRITCPICKTVTTWEENPHRPFCSERCRLHDLGNWVEERYRVEGEEAVPEGPSEDEAEPDERS